MNRRRSSESDGWASQREAARLNHTSDRNIRRWLENGRLKRRGPTDPRVNLRAVERLIFRKTLVGGYEPQTVGKLVKRQRRPGRPLTSRICPWDISKTADGSWLCSGQPVCIPPELAQRIQNANDVARLVEIRILAGMVACRRAGYTGAELLKFNFWAREWGNVVTMKPLPEEASIYTVLAKASWWEVYVLTTRHLHKAIQDRPPPPELGDRPITKRQHEEIQRQVWRQMIADKLRPKSELRNEAELSEHLDSVLDGLSEHDIAYIAGYFSRPGRFHAMASTFEESEKMIGGYLRLEDWQGLTRPELLAKLKARIIRQVKYGKLILPPPVRITNDWKAAPRYDIEASREKLKQEDLETKWGRLAHGVEPTRSTRRCYPFHRLLDNSGGISRRMAAYWKRRTKDFWRQLNRLKLLAVTKAPPTEKTLAVMQSVAEKQLLAAEKDFDPGVVGKLPPEIVDAVLNRLKREGRTADYAKAIDRYNRACLECESGSEAGDADK